MSLNLQNPFRNMPPVVLNLLIINTAIYLFMALLPGANISLTKYLALYYPTSQYFYPWQLLSYMFLHANFGHLFFNMFALVMFGCTIERTMGSSRFLFYYLTCGICAGLMQLGVFAFIISNLSDSIGNPELVQALKTGQLAYAEQILMTTGANIELIHLAQQLISYVDTPMVGASGAIYGVLLAFGFLYPNAPVYLFFIPVPIKAKWLIIGYFVLELVYGVADSADGVAHFAHLGGMIFGFLLLLYWKKRGTFNNHWFF